MELRQKTLTVYRRLRAKQPYNGRRSGSLIRSSRPDVVKGIRSPSPQATYVFSNRPDDQRSASKRSIRERGLKIHHIMPGFPPTNGDLPKRRARWLHEIEWDGYRARVRVLIARSAPA